MFKRILVAYDDTDSARRALDRAAALAKAFDSEVIVTSVAPLMASSPRSTGPIDPTDSPAMHEEELQHARAMLQEQGVEAQLVPATGDPAGAIAMLADERGADLVVVGTREAHFAERVLHQSVSASVARRVHRDLLIVHPPH
jgi:nucleotide-binding universal stress UspA family protein